MILAVDPGFNNYGYAIIDNTTIVNIGLITTKKVQGKTVSISDAIRIRQITRQLIDVIEDNNITQVVGELPIGGGKSSSAVKCMAYVAALSNAVFEGYSIEPIWTTPHKVKKTATGRCSASKIEMMESICKLYGWEITTRVTNKKKGTTANVYWPLGEKWTGGSFEHVADALWAYETLKDSL